MKCPQEVRDHLVDICLPQLGSTHSYAFAMETDEGVSYHVHNNRPCYGELRKYKTDHDGKPSVHVGMVTGGPKNDVKKPSDLPKVFPDGKPLAVLFARYEMPGNNDESYLDWLFGPSSPYIRGFGSPEMVERILNKDGQTRAILLRDTEVDPTVMVNTFQKLRDTTTLYFEEYVKAGMTEDEAGWLTLLSDYNPIKNGVNLYQGGYSFAQVVDVRRLTKQDPHDFSGGTFYERFDYHRPFIQDLFKAKDGVEGFNYGKDFTQKFGKGIPVGLTYEEFIPWFRERLQHYG